MLLTTQIRVPSAWRRSIFERFGVRGSETTLIGTLVRGQRGILPTRSRRERDKDVEMPGRLVRFRIEKRPADVDHALQYIVRTAWTKVPVYQRLWKPYVAKRIQLANVRDLQQLPVVQKSDLVAPDLTDRLRQGTCVDRCVRRGTSGTTGPPIDILFGRIEFRYRQLTLLRRVLADLGCLRPFRWAEVGAWIPLEQRSRPLQKGGVVPLLRLPRSLRPTEQIDVLERFRPHVVSGCPGDLQLVAEQLARRAPKRLRPQLVISRGETLRKDVEDKLREAFRCPVTDYYNVQEVGNLAWRCPDHAELMHVNLDTALLEVVDTKGEPLPVGIEGDVVVTSLTNATMPFIRYALRDRASWIHSEPRRCSCGALGPSLSLVQGRSDDFIVLPNGDRLSPRAIDDLVMETFHKTPQSAMFLTGIHTYQIVQEAIDHLVVRIEASPASPPRLLLDVMERGLRAFHRDLAVEFQFVDELPRGRIGKIRRVISAVGHDPQTPQM